MSLHSLVRSGVGIGDRAVTGVGDGAGVSSTMAVAVEGIAVAVSTITGGVSDGSGVTGTVAADTGGRGLTVSTLVGGGSTSPVRRCD
jgi:hypothetical protein